MSNQSTLPEQLAIVSEKRGWFIAIGIIIVLLGILAIAFPFATTIAAKKVLGWLFLISGIVQIVHSFSTRNWSGFILNLLVGLLYVFAGGWLAFFPLTGIITLTVLLALTFIMQGVIEAGLAIKIRPITGWVWMLISAIIAIAAGVMIISNLPSTATWAIGLLVGVNMISTGLAYLFLVSHVKK
jgi:uncharacterized membrane protein HdeD (DUF308 family)